MELRNMPKEVLGKKN